MSFLLRKTRVVSSVISRVISCGTAWVNSIQSIVIVTSSDVDCSELCQAAYGLRAHRARPPAAASTRTHGTFMAIAHRQHAVHFAFNLSSSESHETHTTALGPQIHVHVAEAKNRTYMNHRSQSTYRDSGGAGITTWPWPSYVAFSCVKRLLFFELLWVYNLSQACLGKFANRIKRQVLENGGLSHLPHVANV
jgi:hypothetical protein